MLRTFGSLATVVALFGSTGWAAPRIWKEGDPVKTMRQEWKRTLGAVTLLAAIGNPESMPVPVPPTTDAPAR